MRNISSIGCVTSPDRVRSQVSAWPRIESHGHCERLSVPAGGHATDHQPPGPDPTAAALAGLHHGSPRTPADRLSPDTHTQSCTLTRLFYSFTVSSGFSLSWHLTVCLCVCVWECVIQYLGCSLSLGCCLCCGIRHDFVSHRF